MKRQAFASLGVLRLRFKVLSLWVRFYGSVDDSGLDILLLQIRNTNRVYNIPNT